MQIPRNPFLNRSMIRDPNAFFGREREVARVATRIAASSPQSTALIGDRRVGKSSFLSHISHPDIKKTYLEDPDKTLFLFLDFQEERGVGIEHFFRTVIDRLDDALPGPLEIKGTPDPEGIRKLVDNLDKNGYRLILLLDEFDRVTRSAQFDADFFGYLRSLGAKPNVAFITSSWKDLQQLCRSEIAESPFFNIFTTLSLGPFRENEARDLITELGSQTPYPIADHAEDILQLSGYLPFFLQAACSAAFEIFLEEDAFDRDAAGERFLEEARPHFQYFWEHFDPVARRICFDATSGSITDLKRVECEDLLHRGFLLPDGRLFSTSFTEFVKHAYTEEVGEEPIEIRTARFVSLEKELNTAREMQMRLLPDKPPSVDGLDVAGRCVPASDVGGDFYTYLWLDDEQTRLGIVAVDVMGKGMEAAVTAMRFSETLRYESRGKVDPCEVMAGLNRALFETTPSGTFVACCFGLIDLGQRVLTTSVGGHYPPLWYRKCTDSVVDFDLGAIPLGLREDTTYESATAGLGQGDVLLFYSDGVVESINDREKCYGSERLKSLTRDAGRNNLEAEETLDKLYADVGRFSAAEENQADDMTVIVARVI